MYRVLLLNAVNPFSEVENRYRPLWAGYLAAHVEKHIGQGVFEFRFMAKSLKDELVSYKPHVVAMSSVTQNYNYAKEYARIIKSYDIPVIIGGMHISALPNCLTGDMDVGCIGEGEETFLELMRHYLEAGGFYPDGLKNINGIIYRENGRLVRMPDRAFCKSIDELPHPQRTILGYGHRSYITTARGCSYKCVFCGCTRFWGNVRYASAEYVMEEIQELVDHGVKVIRFNDDNFVAHTKRLAQIAAMIVKKGFHRKVKFSCWGRANNITPDTVKLLKEMNIVSVVMGLESGCQRTLDYLKGNVTVEENWRAVELLKDSGIQANADFLIGAPDETAEEIMQTYDFIKKSRVDFVTINIFSPLPGTPVWEYAKQKKLVADDMEWGRVQFKFNADEDSALILSERLNHQELYRLYKKLRRLEFIKMIKALPGSPWIDELPGVVYKRAREKFAKIRLSF
jgi:magnesium-protoporphyrin IX monomethyl ester (oxidative) cyclase